MLKPKYSVNSGISVVSRVRVITSAVALATLSACSSSPTRPDAPVERTISINRGGTIEYSPPSYPVYRGSQSTLVPPQGRAVIWGLVGLVLCRALGANWVFSTACAAAGGVIGYRTTPTQAEITKIDGKQISIQLEEVYQSIIRQKPDPMRGYNQSSNTHITRYVSILNHSQTPNGTNIDFKISHINLDGQERILTGQAFRDKKGSWSPIS